MRETTIERHPNAAERRELAYIRQLWEMHGRWLEPAQIYPGFRRYDTEKRSKLRLFADAGWLKRRQRPGGICNLYAPVIDHVDERTCCVCACTANAACWDDERGPCEWVAPELCSFCAEQMKIEIEIEQATSPE